MDESGIERVRDNRRRRLHCLFYIAGPLTSGDRTAVHYLLMSL